MKKKTFVATTSIFGNFYSHKLFFFYININEGGNTFVFHRKKNFHIRDSVTTDLAVKIEKKLVFLAGWLRLWKNS